MKIEVEKEVSSGSYVVKKATITEGEVEGTNVSIEGNVIKIVVGNKKQEGRYQIQLEKVDKDNPETKLSGAEFEITVTGTTKTVTTG